MAITYEGQDGVNAAESEARVKSGRHRPVVSQEVALLLDCVRASTIHGAAGGSACRPGGPIDWGAFSSAAVQHGLLPFAHRQLALPYRGQIPADVLAEWHQSVRSNAIRNLAMTCELLELLDLFERSGITAAPYKGPIFAFTACGDLALREIQDLDIMLHESDVHAAADLLRARGYKCVYQFNYEWGFESESDGPFIELHWLVRPLEGYLPGFPMDPVWQRMGVVEVGDRKVRVFDPLDLLLMLCVHGAADGFYPLRRVCDVVHALSMCGTLDGDEILARADGFGCARAFLTGVGLAEAIFDCRLPEEVRKRVQSDRWTQMAIRHVLKGLFVDCNHRAWNFFTLLMLASGSRNRLRLVGQLLEPGPADHSMFPVPASLAWIYYVLRPLRLSYVVMHSAGNWAFAKRH